MPHTELHPEQQYVFEIARKLGVTPKILPPHKTDTKTCLEKLELLKEENPLEFLDWTLDRIVKALYFSENNNSSKNSLPFIGVITPEFGRNIKQHEIFPRVLEMSKTSARKYWTNSAY